MDRMKSSDHEGRFRIAGMATCPTPVRPPSTFYMARAGKAFQSVTVRGLVIYKSPLEREKDHV